MNTELIEKVTVLLQVLRILGRRVRSKVSRRFWWVWGFQDRQPGHGQCFGRLLVASEGKGRQLKTLALNSFLAKLGV